jgi:hypothetical protein
MKKIVTIILLIPVFSNFSFSQDTNTIKFFPLKIGNVWVYSVSAFGPTCGCSERIKFKAIDTLKRNGHLYFLFLQNTIGGGNCCCVPPFDTLRIDSINCNNYKYTNSTGCAFSPHEIMIDSLKARLNDHVKIYCGSDTAYKCIDTNSYNILGLVRQTRRYNAGYFEGDLSRSYAKGVGIISTFNDGTWGSCTTTLLGCVINGIVYGDTTFPVGINQISSEIPSSFVLSQNYPNPFNPSTKINYELPITNYVKLVIYDVLGKEVEILVNQMQKPGSYEVEWDASNYPSGVYFYKIESGDFTQVKKMILMK